MYYLLLADGFEEIEALTPVDILRRAGIEIKTAGVDKKDITGAHGITVLADTLVSDIEEFDGIILPGGMPGTLNLGASKKVVELVMKAFEEKKLLAAICAAPSILGELGLLKGRKAACYPGFEDKLLGAEVVYDSVAKDENIITSRGMGTAIDFALALAEYIKSESQTELSKAIIYNRGE